MTRNFLRVIARGLAGVLVFAQMAVASYACPGVSAALAAAEAASAASEPQGTPSPATLGTANSQTINCDAMGAIVDTSSPNLCAEHCRYGQQSDQASTITVPPPVLTALYVTLLLPDLVVPSRPTAAWTSALVAAAPPHTKLHCVYRI